MSGGGIATITAKRILRNYTELLQTWCALRSSYHSSALRENGSTMLNELNDQTNALLSTKTSSVQRINEYGKWTTKVQNGSIKQLPLGSLFITANGGQFFSSKSLLFRSIILKKYQQKHTLKMQTLQTTQPLNLNLIILHA